MGVFDAFKNIIGGGVGGEGAGTGDLHQVLTSAIESSSAGGLGGLMDKLHQGGLGELVSSWCSGEAAPVSGEQLRGALGDEHIQTIASKLGIEPDQALSFLQQHLPALAAQQRPGAQ